MWACRQDNAGCGTGEFTVKFTIENRLSLGGTRDAKRPRLVIFQEGPITYPAHRISIAQPGEAHMGWRTQFDFFDGSVRRAEKICECPAVTRSNRNYFGAPSSFSSKIQTLA